MRNIFFEAVLILMTISYGIEARGQSPNSFGFSSKADQAAYVQGARIEKGYEACEYIGSHASGCHFSAADQQARTRFLQLQSELDQANELLQKWQGDYFQRHVQQEDLSDDNDRLQKDTKYTKDHPNLTGWNDIRAVVLGDVTSPKTILQNDQDRIKSAQYGIQVYSNALSEEQSQLQKLEDKDHIYLKANEAN